MADPTCKVGVEVDGASHSMLERKRQDAKKDRFLAGLGWTVLRFSNQDVMERLAECVVYQRGILEMIATGYLADLRAVQVGTDADLRRLKVVHGDLQDAEIAAELLRSGAIPQVAGATSSTPGTAGASRCQDADPQERAGRQLHLCPLPFDLVERLIVQYSMPGETVFDPFAGLMTVPYCAVKLGRCGVGVELNRYFAGGVAYVQAAARKATLPTLFDLLGEEKEDESA